MKRIIEIEDKPIDGLYKAKAFKTLVFDEYGLAQLRPWQLDQAALAEAYEKGMNIVYGALRDAYKIDTTINRIAPSVKAFVLNHDCEEFLRAVKKATEKQAGIEKLQNLGVLDNKGNVTPEYSHIFVKIHPADEEELELPF